MLKGLVSPVRQVTTWRTFAWVRSYRPIVPTSHSAATIVAVAAAVATHHCPPHNPHYSQLVMTAINTILTVVIWGTTRRTPLVQTTQPPPMQPTLCPVQLTVVRSATGWSVVRWGWIKSYLRLRLHHSLMDTTQVNAYISLF